MYSYKKKSRGLAPIWDLGGGLVVNKSHVKRADELLILYLQAARCSRAGSMDDKVRGGREREVSCSPTRPGHAISTLYRPPDRPCGGPSTTSGVSAHTDTDTKNTVSVHSRPLSSPSRQRLAQSTRRVIIIIIIITLYIGQKTNPLAVKSN